jgi:predicted transcriptional regulator
MADPHNGTQTRVLNAIKQGVSDPKAIATWIDVELSAVKNAINRLRASGDIRRNPEGGYEPAQRPLRVRCALAETWK